MTSQIELTNVNKHYGHFHALKDINLVIEEGTFVALVGPSGCGKSTLLRSLAGLESISGGTMRIAGKTMNGVPPRERDVAMVFQSYALYPHMSVFDNLTYSMRLKRRARPAIESAANEVAKTIGLEKLLKRYPRELSGGQRQRVAMGRAIIRHPKAFLFDEPLSNLDAALRVHMRKEIRALHDRLNATSVYVTHDQIEAMTMADHIVVLRDGVVEQQGTPLELYDSPANIFVAGFIGSPAMNFIRGQVDATGWGVELALAGRPVLKIANPLDAGREVIVGLRPEFLSIVAAADAAMALPVKAVEPTGATTYVTLAGGEDVTVVVNGRTEVKAGDRVGLVIESDKVHVFDAAKKHVLARKHDL